MKYFHIGRDIEDPLFNDFINFLNDYTDEAATLILDCNGGSNHLARIMVNIINSSPEKFTLISVKSYSTAFYILFAAKCKKKIVTNTIGCFHHAYLNNIDLDTISKRPVWAEQKCLVENLKFRDESITDLSWMTKAERNKFNTGKDVFFTFKRMKEIFPDAKVI